MQSMLEIPQNDLTRQESLYIWLRRNKIKGKDIAEKLGCSPNIVSRWLRSDRLPSWRVSQLRTLGIPDELLPRAEDIPSGPKPKKSIAG